MKQADTPEDLLKARARIDAIDAEIIELLARRNKAIKEVVRIKAKAGLAPHQPERFIELLDQVQALAAEKGVNQALVEHIWHVLHVDSVRQQQTGLGKTS
jgi:chorismate mutase